MTENEWLREFASNLQAIMDEDGYCQSDLSQMTGLARSTINRYIHAKAIPSAPAIVAISHALCIDYNDLIEFGKVTF